MSKPKRKAQQENFLQYLLNEFVFFRRDFSFVSNLSLPEAAAKLRHLNYEKQGCGRKKRIVAKVTDGYSFEVKTEQASENTYTQSAKTTGTIFTDDNGMSIIEGSVTMGSSAYWIAIFVLLGLITFISLQFSGIPIEPLLCVLSMYAGSIFLMWQQMYRDRNYLVKIIENAVIPEKVKSWD